MLTILEKKIEFSELALINKMQRLYDCEVNNK
jgi:hypothetical protein